MNTIESFVLKLVNLDAYDFYASLFIICAVISFNKDTLFFGYLIMATVWIVGGRLNESINRRP